MGKRKNMLYNIAITAESSRKIGTAITLKSAREKASKAWSGLRAGEMITITNRFTSEEISSLSPPSTTDTW
jgi:hypothetical protein